MRTATARTEQRVTNSRTVPEQKPINETGADRSTGQKLTQACAAPKKSPKPSPPPRTPTPSSAQGAPNEDRRHQLLRQRGQVHRRPPSAAAPHPRRRPHRHREPERRRGPGSGPARSPVRRAAGVPADRLQRGGGHRGEQRGGTDGPDAALPRQPRGLRCLRGAHGAGDQTAAGHHRHPHRAEPARRSGFAPEAGGQHGRNRHRGGPSLSSPGGVPQAAADRPGEPELQAGGERNLWAHQGNKDRSDHTGNRSHRLQGADRPSQRHQREAGTGPEAGHAASGLRRGAGARCLLRGAGVRAMNGMSNAKEALIAEVLGDMASLIERIEKLGPDMEVSRRELLKASNHLAFQMSGFEGRIAKLSENAVDLCVSQINQKASGVCANTQNTQIAAMQSAAREMFNKEFLPVVNRVVSQLEQLARLFQPDRNPWLPWLTHGGAFVTGAALTWLVVVMIWVR